MQQDKILDYFSLLKQKNTIGKAYLFVGDNFNLVTDVIKLLNCHQSDESFCGRCWDCEKISQFIHPDLFIVTPKTLSITIDDIKEGQQFLRLKSFRAKQKTLIIKEAETIGEAAANAFLKTLEEPPKSSLIIICASKLEGLLPTIVSRCHKIFLPFREPDASAEALNAVMGFLRGERMDFRDRSRFKAFLGALIIFLRDNMLSAEGLLANNKLLNSKDYEIILRFLGTPNRRNLVNKAQALKDVLKIYSAYSTINENLALNLIRMKL